MASGVTSRPVRPVPPVVTMASTDPEVVQAFTRARMASTSSGSIARSASTWPAPVTRSASRWPEVSLSSSRVSEMVRTATRTGLNGAPAS